MSLIPQFSQGSRTLYAQHDYEVLFSVYEAITTSTVELANEAVASLGREGLHNHLEFHQKLIKTTLRFPLENLLLDNFAWIYRRLAHYGLDSSFFLYELHLWEEAYERFLPPVLCLQLKELYMYIKEHLDYLVNAHTRIKQAKYMHFSSEDVAEINQAYAWLLRRDYALLKAYVLEKCTTLEEFLSFFYRIISPVMERVGFEWEEGVISVAKEHMISEQVGDLSMEMFAHFDIHRLEKENDVVVLVATAPRELHAIGAKTITKLLEFYGFKAYYLGADLSMEEIAGAVAETAPDVLVLSVTLEVHLVELQELIRHLRSDAVGFRGSIALGGNALRHLGVAFEVEEKSKVCMNFEEVLAFVKKQ